MELIVLLFAQHEPPNQIGDFIGGGVQGEVTRIKDVNLSLRHVAAIGLRFRKVKR
jgi:hypothetical protein